jgi:hypothetical protein
MSVFTVDTNVLYNAASLKSPGTPLQAAALRFLSLVAAHQISSDQKGRIEREYSKCWTRIRGTRKEYPSFDAAHSLWLHLWERRRVVCERGIPSDLLSQLLALNMKVEGDIGFVESAYASTDRTIVSDDSDFALAREALATRLDVIVKGVEVAAANLLHAKGSGPRNWV